MRPFLVARLALFLLGQRNGQCAMRCGVRVQGARVVPLRSAARDPGQSGASTD